MSNERFVLDYQGVGELLKSDQMRAVMEAYAQEIKNRAGDGFGSRTHVTEQRVIVNIFAETQEAYLDNLENNTLLKAVGR
jgi:hypothetical protein